MTRRVLIIAFALETACAGARDLAAADAPPSGEEQDRLLERMHSYGDRYVSNLPNFLCTQVTVQSEAGLKKDKWHKGDTLTSRMSFGKEGERRTLLELNGKAVVEGQRQSRPSQLTTEGEFGILLSRVLGKQSGAVFTWSRWETVRGRRTAVFDYSVDQEHSTLTLRLSDLANAVIPFRGSVFADPETGAVWRISDVATEIPEALQTRQISTVIDYDEIAIGERKYLLPIAAEVLLIIPTKRIRHELAFRDYRKFEADTTITFGGAESEKGSKSEAVKP